MSEEEKVVDNPDEEVTYSNDQTQEVSQDVTSDSSTEETQPVTGDEQPEAETPKEEELPFHKHPRFKEVTTKNRELSERAERYERELAELKGSNDALKTSFGALGQHQKTEAEIQEEQAVEALRGKMGIPQLEEIAKQNETLRSEIDNLKSSQNERLINQEVSEITKLIKDHNLGDTEEVLDSIDAHMDQNPLLAKMKGTPGAVQLAFNNMFAGNIGKMAVKSANGEIIKQQNKAKAGRTEKTGSISGGKGAKDISSGPAAIAEYIESLGGESQISL